MFALHLLLMIDNIRVMTSMFAAIALSISFSLCPAFPAEHGQGSVCFAPSPSTRPSRFAPGELYNPATLSVRIDKRPAVLWPHKESLKIEGLDITQRHLFVELSDGKPLQSFWFRFADFKSTELCFYLDGYSLVEVKGARDAPWCKCK